MAARAAVDSRSRSPTDGWSEARIRASSVAIRSPDRCPTSGAVSRIAASVAGSIVQPSVAAKRIARTIRSASSSNRFRGSPTARMTPARMSPTPS
jgi:hypothetical protein